MVNPEHLSIDNSSFENTRIEYSSTENHATVEDLSNPIESADGCHEGQTLQQEQPVTMTNPTVSQLDESELLAQIFPHLPSNDSVLIGPGDDCASVAAPHGSFVVSTDILIEGVHFRTDWSTGYQVGWRAAMQNLADVAAMGARPTSLVVGLGLPRETEVSWVTEFARGLGDASRSVGAACVGGDLSSAPALFISVTVHGDPVKEPVVRSGAQPGHVLAVAGHTGWSAAGLHFLSLGVDAQGPVDSLSAVLALQTFRAPTSPIVLGEAAALGGATAMMDISDGLVRDAQRICKASGVKAVIDFRAVTKKLSPPQVNQQLWQGDEAFPFIRSLPKLGTSAASTSAQLLHELALRCAGGHDALASQLVVQWLLSGGEDHGFLAAFPDTDSVPEGFHEIGRFVGHQESATQEPATQFGAVQVLGVELDVLNAGWDHFR